MLALDLGLKVLGLGLQPILHGGKFGHGAFEILACADTFGDIRDRPDTPGYLVIDDLSGRTAIFPEEIGSVIATDAIVGSVVITRCDGLLDGLLDCLAVVGMDSLEPAADRAWKPEHRVNVSIPDEGVARYVRFPDQICDRLGGNAEPLLAATQIVPCFLHRGQVTDEHYDMPLSIRARTEGDLHGELSPIGSERQ